MASILTMTTAEREAFLAEPHIGVLSVARDDGRGPLAVPIWYSYEPGGLVTIGTHPTSPKARLIVERGRYTLTAHVETPPYRYVSVEGPVVSSEPVGDDEMRAMVERYLPAEEVEAFLASPEIAGSVAYRMRPERWNALDYAKLE